jgi:hypothetical protein
MHTVKTLFQIALVLVCLPVRAGAGEPPKPPPDPGKVRDAQNTINGQTRDVNRGADALPADIKKTNDQLDKLNKIFDKEIKPKLKKAKDKADEAAKAAKDAKDAATQCDKTKFARLKKRAEDLMKESRDASRSAEDQANVAPKLKNHITNLQGEKPIIDAKADGLADNSDAVEGYRRAQARVEQKLNDQQGNLDKIDKTQRDLNEKMAKAKEGLDPSKSLEQADSDLQDGATWLENNCPPKTSAVPRETTDVFAFVNNQPQSLACFIGQFTPAEAAALKQEFTYEVLASTSAGTVIRSPASADAIERIAKEKGKTLCFASEADFCIIMTPLTGFRGHDHEAHMRSNRAIHDHEAPDPPWDWGVTPPETVIRWEGR